MKNKNVNRNKKKIDFASMEFPSYEEVRIKIDKKIGVIPVMPEGLEKGNWSEQSLQVLEERYLFRDGEGKIMETPEGMAWRVAFEIASAEVLWGKTKKEVTDVAKEFYQKIVSHQFLPNSPTLMNAGTKNKLQYSGCFVIPIEDSLVGIFDALKYQALIHQTGGGTGFSFSRLRPSGSMVKSSRGVASGPVSFMRIFDAATNEIKQGGKRRGANMGILRVDHPDILEFIHCKEKGEITNFNISVGLTDAFMEAYEKGGEYELKNPKTGQVEKTLSAIAVFDEITKLAWETGDPGLIFLDRINKGFSNPVPSLGPIESTNPCGEQPLYPYDSCNLGSIFLTYFVKEENGERVVDWEDLKETAKLAVRFLDDVIEVNPYTLPQIRKTTLAIRRIGLGVGGWADMLISLGIPYDSEEALTLAEKIMTTIKEAALEETYLLAKERGAFPLFPLSIYKKGKARRNSTVTTIAPTGSISIIAASSSGIEPLFAVAFEHIVKDKHLDRKLSFVNPEFIRQAIKEGIWNEDLEKKVGERGVLGEIEEVSENLKAVFKTAHEIDPSWHVKTQIAFQKGTENAVSKTINLKKEATMDDVKRAYLLAWNEGAKGITIFRDGSKGAQVLNLGIGKKEELLTNHVENGDSLLKRPNILKGSTYRLLTPVGSAFITINESAEGLPLEVFINVGKAGSDVAAMAEALGRTISTSLRLRGDLSAIERAREIAEQLSGIGGRRSVGFGPNKIRSLPDAISVAISAHYGFKINGNLNHFGASSNVAGATAVAVHSAPNGVEQTLTGPGDPTAASTTLNGASNGHITPDKAGEILSKLREENNHEEERLFLGERLGDICPACGASSLIFEEGCSKCHSCGHSEC
jgi:ribonucleoside-diphosphate reductase alpha chain